MVKGKGGKGERGQRLYKAPFSTPTHTQPSIDRRSCGLCGLQQIIAFCHGISHAKSEKLSKLFSSTTAVFPLPLVTLPLSFFLYYLLVLLHIFRLYVSSWYFVCHLEKWMPLHALLKGTLKLRQLRIEGSSTDRQKKRERERQRKTYRERGMMIKGNCSHLSYYLQPGNVRKLLQLECTVRNKACARVKEHFESEFKTSKTLQIAKTS